MSLVAASDFWLDRSDSVWPDRMQAADGMHMYVRKWAQFSPVNVRWFVGRIPGVHMYIQFIYRTCMSTYSSQSAGRGNNPWLAAWLAAGYIDRTYDPWTLSSLELVPKRKAASASVDYPGYGHCHCPSSSGHDANCFSRHLSGPA